MLPQTIAFSLSMTFVFNFIDAINRLLGNHVLRGLLLGTYHRPVVEERFVLFLDSRARPRPPSASATLPSTRS
jgi:hypothetical protein